MTGHLSGWGRFYSGARNFAPKLCNVARGPKAPMAPPLAPALHFCLKTKIGYTASVGETSSSRRLMPHTIYKAIADTGHEIRAANIVLKYMG